MSGYAEPATETAKNVLSDACSELHAELAFIWEGFVITTVLFGYLIIHALRMRRRGVPNVSKHSNTGRANRSPLRQIWQKTVSHSAHVASAAPDLFADPLGSAPAFGAGIVDDEESGQKP